MRVKSGATPATPGGAGILGEVHEGGFVRGGRPISDCTSTCRPVAAGRSPSRDRTTKKLPQRRTTGPLYWQAA